MAGPDLALERRALGRSVAASTGQGVLGIVTGVATGSQLILLDGVYAFIGVAVSWLLLLASRVVGVGPTPVYPYGREALAPLVVGVQGFVLLAAIGYAVVDAVGTIRDGGITVAAGWALGYAVLTTGVSVLMWRNLRGAVPGSDLVAAEATAWGVAALLGAGMVAGFTALVVSDALGRFEDLTPYVDPVLVLVVAGFLLPAPVRMVRTTFVELVGGVPPPDVEGPVLAAVADLGAAHGLPAPEVRMTKLGSKLYLEIEGTARPSLTIAGEDEIRRDLRARLAALPVEVWLNFELRPAAPMPGEEAPPGRGPA